MYKEFDSGYIWGMYEEKLIKLCASRLERVGPPSIFHTERHEFEIFREQ